MDPFIGEIKMVSFNFPPKFWAQCDGQILPISQNQALFSILGTTFGGNGSTTFGLPDLRGRVPVHPGNGIALGSKAGEEQHTLTTPEMGIHQHTIIASDSAGNSPIPDNHFLAQFGGLYVQSPPGSTLSSQALSNVGSGQAHENRQPFTVVNFCIALAGIFPSRN